MNLSKFIKLTVIILLILLAYFYFSRYKFNYLIENFMEGVYGIINDFMRFIHNFLKI